MLTVLRVDRSGFKELFKRDFGTHEINIYRNDELIFSGKPSIEDAVQKVDSLGVNLFPYNPTLFYNLNNDFALDSALTKAYNEENYVFAGFEYDANVLVARHDNSSRTVKTKRPYIFKTLK
jgi:hypothetical protein